jgi:uncharacterized membrane protein
MAVDTFILFAGRYHSEADAIADYESVKELYERLGREATFDAAVLSREADGAVKVVRKHEQPTRRGAWAGLGVGLAVGALAALFPAVAIGGALVSGGVGAGLGAVAGHVAGGLSRSDLKDLGELLDVGESGLVVVSAVDLEGAVEQEVRRAERTVKRQLKADRATVEAPLPATA